MHKSLEKNLPFLIEKFSSSDSSIDNRWQSILQYFFSDCTLNSTTETVQQCQLNPQKTMLAVPPIKLKHGYILSINKPEATFNQDDLELATSLLQLAKQFISIEDAFEKGATEERLRIARDLHDDVAARMLTLIHKIKDEKTIAISRSILKSLRNAIYTLDNKSTATILDAVTDVRSEIQDRVNSVGMQLLWHQSDNLQGLVFTPRQHINLNRILHEITTNIIKHADAQFIEIIIGIEQQRLSVECSDNGMGFNIKNCIPGKGINNILTRARELGGSAQWFNLSDKETGKNKGSCVKINFLVESTTE